VIGESDNFLNCNLSMEQINKLIWWKVEFDVTDYSLPITDHLFKLITFVPPEIMLSY
jgi:hypothetical protein